MPRRILGRPAVLVVAVALGAVAAGPGVASGQEAGGPCASPECCREAEGAELHGRVLAAGTGEALPGAAVEVRVTSPPEAGEASTVEVETDDSGAYRLCGLPTPARVEAVAEHSGATSRSVSFELEATTRVELGFEIRGAPAGLDSLRAAAEAAGAGDPEGSGRPGRIVGRIEDAETGRPVAEATVTLQRSGLQALTGSRGRFEIRGAPPGEGELSIRHVAYGEQTVEVDVPSELTVNLEVELPPEAVEVEPIDVKVEATIRSRHLERRGFYDRMERDFGHFWSPVELERRNPLRVSHVLQQTPGVKLLRVCGAGRCKKYPHMTTSTPRFSGDGSLETCLSTVYLDGTKVPLQSVQMGIDEIISTSALAAIEVYRGAAGTAPEFIDSDSRCGVVVLWTKRGPDRRSGRP